MPRSSRRLVRRSAQLMLGLAIMGFAIAFLVIALLGASPWDVLTQGISLHVPISFGAITVVIGAIVLLSWIPLKQKPGPGTIINMLVVGPFADLGFLVIPEADQMWLRICYMLLGVLLGGLSTGMYLGARFGPGPRDGLMTGLHRVTGWPIWVVRTGMEITVVIIGFLLGGVVGVGTVVFALLVGPLVQVFMRVFYISLPSDIETV